MNVRFFCPVCEYPGRVHLPRDRTWECLRCDHRLSVPAPARGGDAPTSEGEVDSTLPACLICGNTELYKKKDFPHTLGLSILAFAFVASTVAYYLYDPWWTWYILLGSAAFDGLLYLWVKDVIVCYRCHAHHRGFVTSDHHEPFELTIHERYRQEQMRREELKAGERNARG